MNLYEQLSRLAEGELDAEEAEALRRRIETEPEVAEAWAALGQLDEAMKDLLDTNPPAIDLQPARPRRAVWTIVAIAAAFLIGIGAQFFLPTAPPEVWIASGVERVSGDVRVFATDVRIDVNGVAEISVEPTGPFPRERKQGGSMERRQWMGAALGAAVTVVVYEGSAFVWASDTDVTRVDAGQTHQIGDPAPRHRATQRSLPPGSDQDEEIESLKLQNRLLESMIAAQQTEFFGEPIPWPAGMEAVWTPEGFEPQAVEAVEACAPDLEVVGFACEEPPCFMKLRTTDAEENWWGRLINDCPQWTDVYGNSVSSAKDNVTCDDGTEEMMQVVGWSYAKLQEFAPDLEREHTSKRFQARLKEIKANWRCQGE